MSILGFLNSTKNSFYSFIGSDDLQTALFFLMNDCVQKAKHDRDQHIPITFHPHIVNAITFSGEAVKKPIRRCLDVLAERSVYPAHVIAEMKAALGWFF